MAKRISKLLLLLSVPGLLLSSCGTTGNNSQSVSQTGSTGDSISTVSSNTTHTYDANAVFRVAKTWDRNGIRNHYHGGTNIGCLEWFAVEPLVQYVRSTDELHYLLAENIVHNADHTTTVNLRHDAKWQTGEAFKADDAMAYWKINFTSLTNYLAKPMEKIDDYTFKMTWKSWMEPNDKVKTLLIAQDKAGSVQYSIFKEQVDKCQQILTSQTRCADGYAEWAPYGYINSKASETEYLANYTAFKAMNPRSFVATGPYKPYKITQNQMILVRNENYYLKDNVYFGKILAYNISDTTNLYNMLTNGTLDYCDGLAPEATLNAILNGNKDMVHLKMFDPGAIGLVFNLEKTTIWTDKVRLAFQYIFDRAEMRNAGNKYAIVNQFPLTGMAPSEAKSWMDPKDYEKIPRYTHDTEKATSLLKEAGWTFTDSKWHLPDGNQVRLSLGYDGSHPGMSGVAEASSSALSNFGIDVVLKRASDFSTWFDTAKAVSSVYDFSVNWTDLNMSFSFPTGSFNYVLNDIDGPIMHLTGITAADVANSNGELNEQAIGNTNLHLDKADGSGKFWVYKYLAHMYSMSDEVLKTSLADLVLGLGNLNYGVSFYQNVTGSFLNTKVIGGLPMKQYYEQERNCTRVPEVGSDDFYAVARTNLIFSQGIVFSKGYYYPAGQ